MCVQLFLFAGPRPMSTILRSTGDKLGEHKCLSHLAKEPIVIPQKAMKSREAHLKLYLSSG